MMYDNLYSIAQDIAARQQQSGYVQPDDTVCVICSASNQIYTGVNRREVLDGRQHNVHAELVALQQMQANGDAIVQSILLISTYTKKPMLPCNGCIGTILAQHPNNAQCQVVLPDRTMLLTEIGGPYSGAAPVGNSAYGSRGFSGHNSMYQNSVSVPYQGAAPTGVPGNSMPYQGAVPNGNPGFSGSMPYQGAAPTGYPNPSGSMPYQGAVPAGSVGAPSGSMPYNSANPDGGRYVGGSLPAGAAKAKNANASMLKNRVGNLMNAADAIDDDDEEEHKTFFGRLFRK